MCSIKYRVGGNFFQIVCCRALKDRRERHSVVFSILNNNEKSIQSEILQLNINQVFLHSFYLKQYQKWDQSFMADENEAGAGALGDGGTEKVKKKGMSGKALILFVVLPLLLIVGGSGGAYFAGVFDGDDGHAAVEEEVVEDAPKVVVFYDLPDMLINLSSATSDASFLKLAVSLELDDETVLPELEKLLPRVMDNFQVYLRELRREDLRGSAGVYRLKEELLFRINSSIKPIQVKDILFKEMLVQ